MSTGLYGNLHDKGTCIHIVCAWDDGSVTPFMLLVGGNCAQSNQPGLRRGRVNWLPHMLWLLILEIIWSSLLFKLRCPCVTRQRSPLMRLMLHPLLLVSTWTLLYTRTYVHAKPSHLYTFYMQTHHTKMYTGCYLIHAAKIWQHLLSCLVSLRERLASLCLPTSIINLIWAMTGISAFRCSL